MFSYLSTLFFFIFLFVFISEVLLRTFDLLHLSRLKCGFDADYRLYDFHVFHRLNEALMCLPAIGAQVPFSRRAIFLFCTLSAFMSLRKCSIGANRPAL